MILDEIQISKKKLKNIKMLLKSMFSEPLNLNMVN